MDVEHVKSPSLAGAMERLDQAAARLAAAGAALETLRGRMAAMPSRHDAWAGLSAMVQACAVARPGTEEYAAALACQEIARRLPALAWPAPPLHPRASVVLLAGTARACWAALRAMALGVADDGVEVLVADAGDDPEVGALASAVRSLRVLLGEDVASSCNLAVCCARGPIVLLASGALPRGVTPAAGEVWVGPGARDALARAGVSLGDSIRDCGDLELGVSRDLWDAAGGLDADMVDGRGLEMADLCLKLRLLGASLVAVGGEQRAAFPAVDVDQGWLAVAAFRGRWGDRFADGLGP